MEWRNGYGDSGSLHLGAQVREKQEKREHAQRERGAKIITIWGAAATLAGVDKADRRDSPPTELRSLGLEQLVRGKVLGADWSSSTGALHLKLSSGDLMIRPDNQASSDNDQWVLESDTDGTFIVRAGPTLIEE